MNHLFNHFIIFLFIGIIILSTGFVPSKISFTYYFSVNLHLKSRILLLYINIICKFPISFRFLVSVTNKILFFLDIIILILIHFVFHLL